MSLAKYLAKAAAMAGEHKGLLGALGGGAAVVGGGMAAEPYIHDYAAHAAMDKVMDDVKQSATDTAEFAQKHPYITAGALTTPGLLQKMLEDGGSSIGGGGEGGAGGQASINLTNHIGSAPRRRRR